MNDTLLRRVLIAAIKEVGGRVSIPESAMDDVSNYEDLVFSRNHATFSLDVRVVNRALPTPSLED